MTPGDFFARPDAARLLQRAAVCSGVPLSLHRYTAEGPSRHVMGFGRCSVCRYVNGTSAGRAACHASRGQAAAASERRGTLLAFVCHLGLGCVCVPALSQGEAEGFVLTLGPFYAAEEPRGLEQGIDEGLEALKLLRGELFVTSDIRIVAAAAVPEMAAWTAEALDRLWRGFKDGGAAAQEAGVADAAPETAPRRGSPTALAFLSPGSDIAAALAGGNQSQGRALLRAALDEGKGGPKTRIGVCRARVLGTVWSAVEGAERAGMNATACWEHASAFAEEVRRARTDEALVAAGMRVLGALRREARRPDASPHEFVELNRLVMDRLPGKVTLNEIAKELGQHPTAITHRLQRKFGMSFSDYVGRLRIDKAKDLLRKTRLGVGDVAIRVGIGDASNFSKLFRKIEGMAPLEYRARFGSRR